jgi:hypothetical protein
MDQERNDYWQYVCNDINESIRKELNFLATPVIFVLNQTNCIINLVFFETHSDCDKMTKKLIDSIPVYVGLCLMDSTKHASDILLNILVILFLSMVGLFFSTERRIPAECKNDILEYALFILHIWKF